MTRSILEKSSPYSGSLPKTLLRQLKKARLPTIPNGSWPRRMSIEYAAAYCGEASLDQFKKRVGVDREYPLPRVKEGRRVLWLRDDLDAAMLPVDSAPVIDAAGDL